MLQSQALPPLLPEGVPVEMPELPVHHSISTIQQFKAISNTTRSKILSIVQHQPATAKQIATRLGATPGAIGHHMKVLEEAGLIQIVARRLVRGIVANYYTRAARIFDFNLAPETLGMQGTLDIFNTFHEQLIDAREDADLSEDAINLMAFPHARLSDAKAQSYAARLNAIVEDLLAEPAALDGDVYGIFVSLFKSPAYMQSDNRSKERDV
ncbi:MAG TPA: ArsR family transcriptional regulator [Anaerolineae bacterium]